MTVERNGFASRPTSAHSVGSVSEGMGEEGMMGFISSHMESILKPFADNVEELYQTVLDLSSNMDKLQTKTESNIGLLQRNTTRIDGIQERQDRLIAYSDAHFKMLETTIDETGKHEEMRSLRIEKVDETLHLLQSAVEELRKNGKDTNIKLAAMQDTQDKQGQNSARLESELGHVARTLQEIDKAHATTIETMNKNKLLLDTTIMEKEMVELVQKEHKDRIDLLNKHCADSFEMLDSQHSETQRQLLQNRKEAQEASDATRQRMSIRLDKQNVINQETSETLKKIDVELANQSTRMDNNTLTTDKLLRMQHQQHADDMQAVRRDLGDLGALTSKHSREVAELQTATGAFPGTAKNRVDLLEEEAHLSYKRNLRIEKVMQLDAMTKENMDDDVNVTLKHGTLLSDDQINQMRSGFLRYDTDNSGLISAKEVGSVLSKIGVTVDKNIIDLVMDHFDMDRDGEVTFDEFCDIMAKMLGPDGEVDVERYMKNISEHAVREAKQNEVVELFPVVQAEVKKHQDLLELEQSKLQGTTDRLQKLEGNHATLLQEMLKLRKGLELNNANWKGMAQGFRTTKKAVHVEDEGEMLSGTMNLRKQLPSVASSRRPPSARSLTGTLPAFAAG